MPAKGVTGSGYEGHYFWDSEVYVAPFLSYTRPELARNLMHFRSRMLPERVKELVPALLEERAEIERQLAGWSAG